MFTILHNLGFVCSLKLVSDSHDVLTCYQDDTSVINRKSPARRVTKCVANVIAKLE